MPFGRSSRETSRPRPELQREDDALDRINRQVLEATYALDGDPGERELAMRYMLIALSLKRIGDNRC
jgi:phosphate uptake regulator